MFENLSHKILKKHLIEGIIKSGKEIKIKVDQTLTQDSTGTMVYLQLEAMGILNKKTELSVAYIDHNTLQNSFENADDHEFIKTVAAKYRIIYSKPGNGICHQLHLERFSKPGKTLIGSDSHTSTSGGIGMLAIGAGGLDVAIGIGKGYYYMKVPKIMNINLIGNLDKWVSAKDVILYILGKLTVKGGVGYILEYSGEGVKKLSVTDRATITNMGAELGATTSIFPSDEKTKEYLMKQSRGEDFVELSADLNAEYDEIIEIDLSKIKPLVAMAHSPDNIEKIANVEKIKIDQVIIGSCTNSSYIDLMKVSRILKDEKVHPDVSLVISPGSSNILKMMADNGALSDLIKSGARILEASCGPCIGMGQAPKSNSISLRTFNRNFKGRCGTLDSKVYLVSPETAAISSINGYLTEPSEITKSIFIDDLGKFETNENYFIYPSNKKNINIIMGPNIKPFPLGKPLSKDINGTVILKIGDNITTDDIIPSNSKLLPLRSNIPKLSKYCFANKCNDFEERTKKFNGGIIVAGENYGQGSSREHAALTLLHLNIKVVIAKSFARIHKSNLINSGILPLEFYSFEDYEKISIYDELEIINIVNFLNEDKLIEIKNINKNNIFGVKFIGSKRDKEILLFGGAINYLKNDFEEMP